MRAGSTGLERRTSLRSGPGALTNNQDDQDELDRLAKPTLTRRKGEQQAPLRVYLLPLWPS